MKFPRAGLTLTLIVCSWLVAGVSIRGQDTLARAKDLYVRAAYDEALVLLERMHNDAPPDEAAEIAGYQMLCLLALGRTEEAHRAIEALVKANPQYRPSEAMASPRTRALFEDVRRKLLPGIVQESYDTAKAAFDRNDHKVAVSEFDKVIALLSEPGVSELPGMADLRRLADGFKDLSAGKVAAPAAANPPPKAPETAPVAPKAPAIYSAADADVVPPVSVSQETPPWRPSNKIEARREFQGIIAVVIDEKGEVTSAVVGKSVHPDYDEALLKMARTWKFRPATKDGVPVRYRKGIEIRLRPSS